MLCVSVRFAVPRSALPRNISPFFSSGVIIDRRLYYLELANQHVFEDRGNVDANKERLFVKAQTMKHPSLPFGVVVYLHTGTQLFLPELTTTIFDPWSVSMSTSSSGGGTF